MPIDNRRSECDYDYVVTTECSLCGKELSEGQGMATHLQSECEEWSNA